MIAQRVAKGQQLNTNPRHTISGKRGVNLYATTATGLDTFRVNAAQKD